MKKNLADYCFFVISCNLLKINEIIFTYYKALKNN